MIRTEGIVMHYDYTAITDAEVPTGVEPAFRHTLTTYASEVNKTVGVRCRTPCSTSSRTRG